MSYADGWAALNLDMPRRVPHTEYSVERHWDVVRHVTGIQVAPHSPEDLKARASFALMRAWNFDFRWCTLLNTQPFGDLQTDMGHAEYEAERADWRDHVFCPFKTPEEVLSFDFEQAYGVPDRAAWQKRFEQDYRQRCQETLDLVNMTGVYTTLLSGFIAVFGWEMLLLAAGTDPVRFGELANRYAAWMLPHFEALAAADVPVVMVHDDMVWSSGPFISPKWYRQYVFPNFKRYFAPLIESGKKLIFTSDGNYTPFIDDLVACGVYGFVLEPFTDMAYLAEKYGHNHVFIGNADTRILLSGSKADIRREVERCLAIGKPYPGFFMAVGNHIPANTPVESVLYYEEVYEELSRR